MSSPLEILKTYFNAASFRGCQEEVIRHILDKNHSLVLMPTGAGKSVCYQIPALIFPGGTLVISPLIALMQDQVEGLKKRNITAAYINSTVSREDKARRLKQFVMGKVKLLYVTPERFRKKEFVLEIQKANIALLAVDEAHCISSWGHDFRPDYSCIGDFRKIIGNPLTIALTATATREVQRDIITRLGLSSGEMKIFHQGITRPNLRLEASEVMGDEEKVAIIEKVITKNPGSGIVYFSLIKTLESFSHLLDMKGIGHLTYHGKLGAGQRKKIQNQFMKGSNMLVLATNAFGMGIDKSDIRFVIHGEIPGSLESYYQEIGRAGRDRKPSLCSMLYNQDDLMIHMDFINSSNPEPAFYEKLYQFLEKDITKVNALGMQYLSKQLSLRSANDFRLETAMGMLEMYNVTEGKVESGTLKLISKLSPSLVDEKIHEEKITDDRKKLLSIVNYFRDSHCRRVSIEEYFGFKAEPCSNCDTCEKNEGDR